MKNSLLLWLLLICPPLLKGQSGQWGIGIDHYRGFLWAHRKIMLPMQKPTQGVDFLIFKNSSGETWAPSYRFPVYGLSISYLNLGDAHMNGHVIGLLPFIEFRMIHRSRLDLNFRMGTGLGYVTRTWELVDNPKNKAIGSHLNGNMRVHLILGTSVFRNLNIRTGVGMTHYSNGNFRMPNLGINSVECFLGIGLKNRTRQLPQITAVKKPVKGSHRIDLTLRLASKETDLIQPHRVFAGLVGVRYSYGKWSKSRIAAGLDYAYDPAYLYPGGRAPIESDKFRNASEAGFFFGHELLIGRFSFLTDAGFYFYRPSPVKGVFYQRLGFKYQLHPNWFISSALKTHFARADFFEWGLGYTISR